MTPLVEVLSDQSSCVAAAMRRLRDALTGTAGKRIVCLSGGRTPQPFYVALAEELLKGQLPTDRLHWVIGDERAVPVEHPRSNLGMIRRILFEPAGIPFEQIHAMPADATDLDTAARAFEMDLQKLYGATDLDPLRPFFDFNLLGLGEDGHVASLFPGSSALEERRRWVVPTRAPNGEARMSLTLPILNSSRHVVLLVAGVAKRDALARWRRGEPAIPASRLNPPSSVVVLADSEAGA